MCRGCVKNIVLFGFINEYGTRSEEKTRGKLREYVRGASAAFNEKYPKGFSDYLPDLVKYPKPDGTTFYAVTVRLMTPSIS